MNKPPPTDNPQVRCTELGPKQIAWINLKIGNAGDGAKRVARADATAKEARRLALGKRRVA